MVPLTLLLSLLSSLWKIPLERKILERDVKQQTNKQTNNKTNNQTNKHTNKQTNCKKNILELDVKQIRKNQLALYSLDYYQLNHRTNSTYQSPVYKQLNIATITVTPLTKC